jgi:hypothetical protein
MTRNIHRVFTLEEDMRIFAQTRGEISINQLIEELGSTRDTIEKRASELGVTLLSSRTGRRTWENPANPTVVDHGDNPYRIHNDLLLAKLIDEHGDRRYEELRLRKQG